LIGMAWDMDGLVALGDTAIAVLEVAIGLGLVIFVHELGHFSVAKLCGVKCEKFYLGFDIGGWKLWRHRWGETEYGIGILPLGGYVKMLGQEDNPARLKDEIERAKATAVASTETVKAEQALYDPRSFLAQSVPKRMAIISAGVIMNLIFAFILAVVAYRVGIRQVAAGVGGLMPGEAAWQSNFKVGDRIVEIAGRPIKRFQDLQEAVLLGDVKDGIPVVVHRENSTAPIRVTVTPNSSGLAPRIGIAGPSSTKLLQKDLRAAASEDGKESASAFETGDQFIKVNNEPIASYSQIHAFMAKNPDKTIQVTVQRKKPTENPRAKPTFEEVVVTVPPKPMLGFGVEMEMGEIYAVQKDSPAEAVGLHPGDLIREIDNQPVGDPLSLPDRLRRHAGETVVLTIDRAGGKETDSVRVTLREADWYSQPLDEGNPIAVPVLGVSYRVLNRVRAVQPDSPAAAAGLAAGDEIVSARVRPPSEEILKKLKVHQSDVTIPFDDAHRNWPFLMFRLQTLAPQTTVELQWRRQNALHTATLAPEVIKDWYNPDRGWLFEPIYVYLTADSWKNAVALGAEETMNATSLVYRTLRKLGSQVSFKALGGPVAIFSAAKIAADQGIANLLLFLTMLSANLAVLNFLPIPLLDGGLMVLLLWEGVRGKPANEHVQVVLTYIGLAFIIVLTLWAVSLDIGLIPRR
jgi:regulator of sigma E protease